MNSNYPRVARALSSYIDSSDQLLDATESVLGVIAETTAGPTGRTSTPPRGKGHLDAAALGSEVVMARIIEGKKIEAIRELRLLASAGLKDLKEAVERVQTLPDVRAAQAAVWNVRVDIGG